MLLEKCIIKCKHNLLNGNNNVMWKTNLRNIFIYKIYQFVDSNRSIKLLSYRHSSGESEISTQPWLSEGSLTCDPYHHRGPIF